ncbi:MAG TPA: hypothetical protein EYH50_01170 [Pyrodictium delaneyi]|uniref:Uncharacterized protein n=1 Tax=Pyrodictium delaneyi TaxID=1273541 RepID=A0A833EAI7_9CREN|nr:hypothetical protein [Pyrodictium delaneyi]
MTSKILTGLGQSLRVYVKPPLQRISIGLGLLAAKNTGSTIYAASPIRQIVSLAIDSLGLEIDVRSCDKAETEGVFLWCTPSSRPLFVAGTEIRYPLKYGLERMTVKRIHNEVYMLVIPRIGLREYVTLNNYLPVPAEPPCRKDIMEAISVVAEEGPINLRDVVDVVASTLGVKRGEARRLVLELVDRGCLEVNADGMVKIAEY